MNRPAITRRHLVAGGVAAVGAVALPATASALAASPADPDAALVDLIARYAAAFDARTAHADAHAAAEDRFMAAYPEIPAVLLLRPGDSFGIGQHMGHTRDGSGFRRRWFDGNAVDALKAVTPSPDLVERRAEILAAFEAWEGEVDAVRDRTGMTAEDEEEDRLYEAVWAARDAITAAVPQTLAGFHRKARWLTTLDDWEEDAATFVRDLAGLRGVSS